MYDVPIDFCMHDGMIFIIFIISDVPGLVPVSDVPEPDIRLLQSPGRIVGFHHLIPLAGVGPGYGSTSRALQLMTVQA